MGFTCFSVSKRACKWLDRSLFWQPKYGRSPTQKDGTVKTLNLPANKKTPKYTTKHYERSLCWRQHRSFTVRG